MAEACEARKQPLPQWFLDEPLAADGDDFYLKAFFELGTCRQLGMGVGPIPWRDMVFYAKHHGLDEITTDLFIHIIKEMDTAYLVWTKKENDKDKPE